MRTFIFPIVLFISILALFPLPCGEVKVGIDRLFITDYKNLLKGKRVGIITNHTAVNENMETTLEVLKKNSSSHGFTITALFGPEHGISGAVHAEKQVLAHTTKESIPVFSLYGKTKRPTKEMLDLVDLLIFDIQDIGSRSYTYSATLFFAMEEAVKHGKLVIVLDRPNPLNGLTVDGPMLEDKWRSIVGYLNIPYCHGMTIGELARYFNGEYKIGCQLEVVPMKGWKRKMLFEETGLPWIPTSPQIPEASTAWFYPTTGALGELHLVSIGIGYTLPFKVVGAPWVDEDKFAAALNAQNFPGVRFYPFHFCPFFGRFSGTECHGVLIVITDYTQYKPITTQYLLLGVLKSLYPEKFQEAVQQVSKKGEMFYKIHGMDEIGHILAHEKYVTWKLKELSDKGREAFLKLRKKYLISEYQKD